MAQRGKVLVDTSVWIDFFRGEANAVKALGSLIKRGGIVICGQVRQEVLQGSRDEKAFVKLEKQMEIWESEAEEPGDFVAAARIFARLRWKGITIPPTDCLIAALAIRRGLQLFAHDDFHQVPGLQLFNFEDVSIPQRRISRRP